MSEELENKEIIARWLNGDLSEEERARLEKRDDLGDLKAVVDDIGTWSLPPVDTSDSLKKLREKTSKAKPETKVISMRPLLRYAAVLALIAVAWFVYDAVRSSGYFNLETGLGASLSHEFPDGSSIVLGALSNAGYNVDTWGDERTVDLEGQAYFDVTSGATFTVKTSNGEVTVLGTQFDVQVDSEVLRVNCFEGSVAVESSGMEEILRPGEGVVFKEGEFDRVVFESLEPGWIGNRSIYKNAALATVVKDLRRYYEVTITLPDRLEEIPFTGSFSHSDLELALRAVFSPLEIKYTLDKGTVVFD